MNEATNRRDRFRAAIQKLDPARPLRMLHETFWRVERDSGLGDIAARLELEPKSIHLVTGPIGSGKSTELMTLAWMLAETDGLALRDVDAGSLDGAAPITDATVAAGIALSFVERLQAEGTTANVKQLSEAVQRILHGSEEYLLPPLHVPPMFEVTKRPGLLDAATRIFSEYNAELLQVLGAIASAFGASGRTPIVLVDGLDRLVSGERFDAVALPVLRALRLSGFGVVMVAPWGTTITTRRVDIDPLVDHTYELLPIQGVLSLPLFFRQMVDKRGVGDFFPTSVAVALSEASGGIPRDMVALAKESLQLAYAGGDDIVIHWYVKSAIDKLGRTMLLGLTAAEVDQLRAVKASGQFVPSSVDGQALLATKRILQFRDLSGLPFYRVHPAIVPLLDASTVIA
jgi:energy-coupling factor transporter ATP-binding protein EcfA2